MKRLIIILVVLNFFYCQNEKDTYSQEEIRFKECVGKEINYLLEKTFVSVSDRLT